MFYLSFLNSRGYYSTVQKMCIRDSLQTAWERAAALEQEWEKKEHSILAFVRHGDLDQVTLSISKLPGYLRYGEVSAYAAEANTVRRMMIHIWESEQFVPVSYTHLIR